MLAFIILCWLGIVLLPASEPDRLELGFRPGAGAAKDPRTVAIVDHPCGKVVIARVTVLPKPSERGALVPEVAVELNASGRVIARWPMPVDSYPIAFEGEKLLLGSGNIRLWVNPKGVVTRYADMDPVPSGADVPCARTAKRVITSFADHFRTYGPEALGLCGLSHPAHDGMQDN